MNPLPFRRFRTRPRLGALPALLLALFPSIGRADVGSLGAIAEAAFMAALAIWSALTLFVGLWVCRRLSVVKRIAWSALFFCFPAIYLAVTLGAGYALGEDTRNVDELTTRAIVVSGVTFPPGSTAEYEQTGGVFGLGAHRTLQSIRSPHPVPLGNVRVDAFTFIPQNAGDEVRVDISPGQTLDGWPCEGDAVLHLTPAGPKAASCTLGASHMWRGQWLQPGAYVDLDAAALSTN
ncbi:hypothetical protein [Burkholderia sp. Ac-20379]|uniref:hypothetical protein n=1 Tax=Burkholderia sp. Ac-20379 TaxID=2703900 RepID=UPI00197FEC8F|nr:hypothetical protein [Burkholderia sp. Ac-20379]MBN3724528.1 hypothetical protein [Burkholderia sp. Ac-20379]